VADPYKTFKFRVRLDSGPSATCAAAEPVHVPAAALRGPAELVAGQLRSDGRVIVGGFKSLSGMSSETEALARVAKIDAFTLTQSVAKRGPRAGAASMLNAMLMNGVVPDRPDFRFMKSRTGHLLAPSSGRIALEGGGRTVASWRFSGGRFFSLGPVAPAGDATMEELLLVHEGFQRV
jgi:hypothetical protein